jgi:gliding motility-associated lipoprotein GldH
MGSRLKIVLLICLGAVSFSACKDAKTLADSNFEIAGHNWSYTEKVQIPVLIEDSTITYNLYLNLRHTADYKYSNIFLLIHTISPNGKKITERKEFRLALPDGEWLGSGSGNLYSYQIPFKENYSFAAEGKYLIELEQNMRDNPLDHIYDVGIRIEKTH